MFENFFKFFNNLNIFDVVFAVIMLYSIVQCFLKGFSLSFISFLKWVISVILTVILVPKLQPWVKEYIESEFINNVGLGLLIFILSLFFMIIMSRSISRAVTWTGMGSIDKTFGLIFGVFKGYLVIVCLFTILNWFYPYQNWGISADKAYTFDLVKKGSNILLDEFPNNEDLIDTKEKIEKI
jgi:membrane protein required for colicin V production